MTDDRQRAEAALADAAAEPVAAPPDENVDGSERRHHGDPEEKVKAARRPRAKMTLRIPDDEVSRPSIPTDATLGRGSVPDGAEAGEEPIIEEELAPISILPTPIINVGDLPFPAATLELPKPAPVPAVRTAPKSNPDDSWTPYQPTVALAPAAVDSEPKSNVRPALGSDPDSIDVSIDDDGPVAAEPAAAAPEAPAAVAPTAVAPAAAASAEISASDFVPDSSDVIPESSSEPLELDEEETQARLSSRPPPPVAPAVAIALPAIPPELPTRPRLEDILHPHGHPVAVAEEDGAPLSPMATEAPPVTPAGGVPAPSTPHVPAAHRSRPPAAAFVDDVEAAERETLQENESIQEIEPDRMSEPPPEPFTKPRTGVDEAELAAEDVVSVESLPAGALQTTPSSSPPPTPTAPKSPPLLRTPLLIVPPIGGPPSPLAPPPIGESAPKRKGRLWWEELFGDDFIRTMSKITDEQIAAEVDFVEDSLGVAKGGTMLDLACGTGRHAIELARRGYQIVGFDLSLAMLARAADEAQDRDQKINFVQGDMREMTFENTFDGIYCWNTSFGFFEEDRNAAVIGKVHKALRAGGQFLLDVVNRDFIVNQSPSLVWFEGDGCICMDEMQMDWITSRMRVKRTMMLDDGRSKEIEYSIRVYSLHELGKLMHDQGFRIAEVSGRTATPGVFFGATSPRTLILAEKKS